MFNKVHHNPLGVRMIRKLVSNEGRIALARMGHFGKWGTPRDTTKVVADGSLIMEYGYDSNTNSMINLRPTDHVVHVFNGQVTEHRWTSQWSNPTEDTPCLKVPTLKGLAY